MLSIVFNNVSKLNIIILPSFRSCCGRDLYTSKKTLQTSHEIKIIPNTVMRKSLREFFFGLLLISFVKLTQLNKVGVQYHRVDREGITIIILDTKLVPDFVLHVCCFFIAGNRSVKTVPRSASKGLRHENRGAKS